MTDDAEPTSAGMDDPAIRLERAFVIGDSTAFAGLVEAHELKVRVVVAAILPERSLVEDVVQEALLVAWKQRADFTPGTDWVAWVKTIARNVARNELRRWLRFNANHERRAVEELMADAIDERAESLNSTVADSLTTCVGSLAATSQEVLRRRYFDNVSVAAIALAAGRTDSWVKMVLLRARAALARCLRARGVMGPSEVADG